MSLNDRFELGWLLAWLLVLAAILPARVMATAAGGLLSVHAGTVLKRRLLLGALRMDADEVRHLGVGQLLGRVIESEIVESLALTGAFLGVTALIELVLAGFVLGAGAGGSVHAILLLGSALTASWLGFRYLQRRSGWTEDRLAMTNDLVERMIGHRTRLAQGGNEAENEGEDRELERYLSTSMDMDRLGVGLLVVPPRGWFLVGLIALVPAFVVGNRPAAALAIGVGGVILAARALRNLVEGFERLAGAAIAWERVQPFWRAAARRESVGPHGCSVSARATASIPDPAASPTNPLRNGRPLLDARDVVFCYPGRGEPVLRGVDLQIFCGDRLLLEGSSGGGKSTLAALLAGSRTPESGLLLFDGLDRAALGTEGWRRRVVLAPQFHENHVLIGTLAFNMLMGRHWPPRPADLEVAESLCRALDLGPLLDRMPGGLLQMVGETGWQLSHGEKSRLYIVRALLQGADLIIIDESFAALDPRTLQRTLTSVLAQAPTILVLAHP